MRLISAALLGAAAASLPTLVHATPCTTISRDGGFNTVSSTASDRLGKDAVIVKTDADREAVAKRTEELLSKPLSMDDAVQVALLNNRGLQASYAKLGLSEANLLQPADATLKVAAEARRAYVNAVAAQEAANYADQVKDSADAGAELASRMRQAGNFSKLDYARQQAFYAESVAQAAKARQQAVSAKEKLTRIMGVWGAGTRYTLPDHLPGLPKERPELKDLEQFAMRNRLDIRAETAIDARSEVRESYSHYVTSYDIAKHYRDEVVPLRKTISEEVLLRYNGMLASVFDLLADSREQAAAVNSYIDSLKDYWLAETDLEQALGGQLPQPGAGQRSTNEIPPTTADEPTPAPTSQPAPATHSEEK
jgi:hypothetical protein